MRKIPRKIEDPRVQKERIQLPKTEIPSETYSKDDLINNFYIVFSIPSKSGSQAYPKILEIMRRHKYIEETIENSMFYVIGFEKLDAELISFWKLLPKGWKVLGVWINGDEFDCGDYEVKHKLENLICCNERGKCDGVCSHDIGLGGWRGLSLYIIREVFDPKFKNLIDEDLSFRENNLGWRLRVLHDNYRHLGLLKLENNTYSLNKERLLKLSDESLQFETKYCPDYDPNETRGFIELIPEEVTVEFERYEEDEDHISYLEERKQEMEEQRKMYMKLIEDILDKFEKRMKKILTEFGDKYLKK